MRVRHGCLLVLMLSLAGCGGATHLFARSAPVTSAPCGGIDRDLPLCVSLISRNLRGTVPSRLSSVASPSAPTPPPNPAPPGVAAPTTAPQTPAVRNDPALITPRDPRSLLRGRNFARAWAILRRRLGSHVLGRGLTIQPGWAELVFAANGRIRSATVGFDGAFVLGAGSVKDQGPLSGFDLSQIGAGTPAALTRRIAAHFHVPIGDLYDINVFRDWFGLRIAWVVNSSDHRWFQAAGPTAPIEEFPPGIRVSAR